MAWYRGVLPLLFALCVLALWLAESERSVWPCVHIGSGCLNKGHSHYIEPEKRKNPGDRHEKACGRGEVWDSNL